MPSKSTWVLLTFLYKATPARLNKGSVLKAPLSIEMHPESTFNTAPFYNQY